MMNAIPNSPLLADWFTNALNGMDHDSHFVLFIVAMGCVTGIICTLSMFIFSTVNSIHRRRIEADMKREMLDRGMSADDIAKIIEAASPPEDGTQRWIASWARRKKSA